MPVTIRKLQEEDIDGISDLWKQFAEMREGMTGAQILNEDAADYFFAYATGLLQRKDTLTLVAEDDGQLIGYLIAQQQRKPPIYHHTRVAYLSDVFVIPAYRKQGILKQFIADLRAWCAAQGMTAIDVMLFTSNTMAQEIYTGMGFDPYRIVMRESLDGQPGDAES